MKLPQIQLDTTFIQHGIHISKPVQKIEQPQAIMEIQQPKAELTVNRSPSKLTIDQSQAWEDMNLKSTSRLSEDNANYGRQMLLQAIGRIASDGDELMKIANGGNVIANQAMRNSQTPQKEFNIGYIPSPFSVKINYEPSQLNIEWNISQPLIHVEPQKPIHEYTPGKVQGSIEKWNDLKIDFINLYA